MIVRGQTIKNTRKLKKLSQKQLASGICSQSTLSNIENIGICKDFSVLIALCERLNLNIQECISQNDIQYLENLLNMVNTLCIQLKHKQAYQLIQPIHLDKTKSNQELYIKFLYFKGLTNLLGINDLNQARNFLLKSSKSENGFITIYNILSLNTLGTVYELEHNYAQAEIYYEKSMRLLDKFKYQYPVEACRMFYNTAKFYSEIKEYSIAVSYSEKGLDVIRQSCSGKFLEYLLYEKAFNLYQLGKNADFEYKQTLCIAEFFQNTEIMKYIKKDMEVYFCANSIKKNNNK